MLIRLSEEGAEVERVEQLTGYLRQELLSAGVVDDVRAVPAGETPPGARGVEVALVGSLLLGLGKSLTGLSQVVNVLRDWLGRFGGTRPSLTLTLDGDTLEISAATDEQVAEAVKIFLEKHSAVGT
ncbi:hypothetical protein BEK98_38755 [Streptomyces diastatochromogenes]|uniref:Uncharacterized protein n=1 Tax=Streptomyces diastatochromogenes TaxID=42236 RepID=A0A233S158_STRDA|nr:hypothetical protein BEK98_38755 [Streptomyces diastatochromogenes]